jgi:hypothetical protein
MLRAYEARIPFAGPLASDGSCEAKEVADENEDQKGGNGIQPRGQERAEVGLRDRGQAGQPVFEKVVLGDP